MPTIREKRSDQPFLEESIPPIIPGHIGKFAGKNLLAQKEAISYHSQTNTELFAVTLMISGVATFGQWIGDSLPFLPKKEAVVLKPVCYPCGS